MVGQNGSETSEVAVLGEQERVQDSKLGQSLAEETERVDGLETIRRKNGLALMPAGSNPNPSGTRGPSEPVPPLTRLASPALCGVLSGL